MGAELRLERGRYVSFDGGLELAVMRARPDRYRVWRDREVVNGPLISRGAGLSYVAASFGGGATTLESDAFDRILDFSPQERTVTVEAGIRLGGLFAFLAARGFFLPTQPGHPAISVGGCVAADVHGKNQPRDGTFTRQVLGMSLFHPRHGVIDVSSRSHPEVLRLTCGGYGLTGTILTVTLRVAPIASGAVVRETIPIADIFSLREEMTRASGDADFIFTWHDFMARGRRFGRGILEVGRFAQSDEDARVGYTTASPSLRADARRTWRLSLFNRYSARAFTALYHAYAARPRTSRKVSLFTGLFPIVGRESYFKLFGRRGFFEYQSLVPNDAFATFLETIQKRLEREPVAVTLASTKAFVGRPELLRFDGTGTVLALNFPRSRTSADFMRFLDDLVVGTGSKPNIIKDSRLPLEVVRRAYPEYEPFRAALREFDPDRIYRSALSERLAL